MNPYRSRHLRPWLLISAVLFLAGMAFPWIVDSRPLSGANYNIFLVIFYLLPWSAKGLVEDLSWSYSYASLVSVPPLLGWLLIIVWSALGIQVKPIVAAVGVLSVVLLSIAFVGNYLCGSLASVSAGAGIYLAYISLLFMGVPILYFGRPINGKAEKVSGG